MMKKQEHLVAWQAIEPNVFNGLAHRDRWAGGSG